MLATGQADHGLKCEKGYRVNRISRERMSGYHDIGYKVCPDAQISRQPFPDNLNILISFIYL